VNVDIADFVIIDQTDSRMPIENSDLLPPETAVVVVDTRFDSKFVRVVDVLAQNLHCSLARTL
jgi:hypothetical protein